MDTGNSEIVKIIDLFKAALLKYGIKVEKTFLFGSHVKGNSHQYSDIDIVIISSDFEKFNFKERCEVLGKAIVDVMEPIEPLAYTPEEFALLSLPSIGAMIAKNQIDNMVF